MSIKEVARIAGVSIATVSRYLNSPNLVKPATQRRVEEAIQSINYQPNTLAQNFRRGRSRLIVVVIRSIGDVIYEGLTSRMAETARHLGYEILVKEAGSDNLSFEYYRNILTTKQAEGVIVTIPPPSVSSTQQLILEKLPIMFVGNQSEISPLSNQTICDNAADAAKSATEYLIQLGHQFIYCFRYHMRNYIDHSCEQGFVAAMKSADLNHKTVFSIDTQGSNLSRMLRQAIEAPNPATAILCSDDNIAIDLLYFARCQGIHIPDQLSVMGFNNNRHASKSFPSLTTIEQPTNSIAERAVIAVCQRMSNNRSLHLNTETPDTKHQLIIRSSTRPLSHPH